MATDFLEHHDPRTAGSSADSSDGRTSRSREDGPVRVLLVNAEEIIAEGLRGMLAAHNDRVELVGCLSSTEDAPAATTALDVDVVLLHVPTRATAELELAARMVGKAPTSRVVIFSDKADERRLFEALRLGAAGYLLKSQTGAQLAEQLLRARRGEIVVDPTMAANIALRAAQLQDGQGWPGSELGLSRRESDVLGHLGDGLSNREIAARLVVGEETVKTHLSSIYRKLGVTDRAQAVAYALRQGILT